jgi:hypothetical protein
MFKNKEVKPTKKQVVIEPKVLNPLVHMVDVNMAITERTVNTKHVFKDKEPIKKKFVADWEKKQRLQQSFINII